MSRFTSFLKKLRKKVGLNTIVFVFILLGNFWIWKVFSFHFLLGVFLTIVSIFLYSATSSRKVKLLTFGLLILLVIFQVKTGEIFTASEFSKEQKTFQTQRMGYYNQGIVSRGIRYLFEVKDGGRIIFGFLGNISEVVDPNLYFFANHPRERVGVKEFSKFPFLYVFPFWIGLMQILMEKNEQSFRILFLLSISLYGFAGSRNEVGPFLLFPFFVYILTIGTQRLIDMTVKRK